MPRKVRIGVIGLGWPGQEHLKHYKAIKQVDVEALCDIDAELAQRIASENDVKEVYSDHEDLLRNEKIDAVSVCLPNYLHSPVTIDALKASKHVLCEKPPALNAKQAQKMADVASGNGKILMYALMQRFRADVQIVKDFVESGDLGKIYFAKTGYVRRRDIPSGSGGWFLDKSRAGGGALIDIGVHALDRAWYMMGNPKPVSVSGSVYSEFGHTLPKKVKFDVDDSAFGLIKFENGATLYVEATWAVNYESGSFNTIAGTKGGAQLDPLVIYTERKGTLLDITPNVEDLNPFALEIEHFIDCITTGKEPMPSAEQGVMLMQMLDGIYRSSKTGKEVKIK